MLEVINSLGYVKLSPAEINGMHMNQSTASAKPMSDELADTNMIETMEAQIVAAKLEC